MHFWNKKKFKHFAIQGLGTYQLLFLGHYSLICFLNPWKITVPIVLQLHKSFQASQRKKNFPNESSNSPIFTDVWIVGVFSEFQSNPFISLLYVIEWKICTDLWFWFVYIHQGSRFMYQELDPKNWVYRPCCEWAAFHSWRHSHPPLLGVSRQEGNKDLQILAFAS